MSVNRAVWRSIKLNIVNWNRSKRQKKNSKCFTYSLKYPLSSPPRCENCLIYKSSLTRNFFYIYIWGTKPTISVVTLRPIEPTAVRNMKKTMVNQDPFENHVLEWSLSLVRNTFEGGTWVTSAFAQNSVWSIALKIRPWQYSMKSSFVNSPPFMDRYESNSNITAWKKSLLNNNKNWPSTITWYPLECYVCLRRFYALGGKICPNISIEF